MSIKIAIVGENSNTRTLIDLLNSYSIDNNFHINITTLSDTSSLLKNTNYHIIFFNIQKRTTNKLEIAKYLSNFFPHIKMIIISNYDDFYYEAFKIHCFDYILNPLIKNNVYKLMDDILKHDVYFTFKTLDNTYVKLAKNEIMYFESLGRNSKAIAFQGNFIIKNKIRDLSRYMINYDFCIPHQSFIVNFQFIKSYTNTSIIMINHLSIPISQTRLKEFKKQYKEIADSKLNICNMSI